MRKVWLLPWALMAVVAACKSSAPVEPHPPDPGLGLGTINPQSPSLTGWIGKLPNLNVPANGAFQASIHQLPQKGDDPVFTYQQGTDTYEFHVYQADPCPARYQGNEIPLTLYKVLRRAAGSLVRDDICKGTTYQSQNPNACEASPGNAAQYAGAAIAVPGRWDDSGGYSPCDAGTSCFTISCLSGVVGECAHWVYVPQYRGPDGTLDLVPYLQACVRAASGDYVGNGDAFTCKGTYIDVIDDLGIQKEDDPTIAGMEVEAGWTGKGATAVGTSSPVDGSPAGGSPVATACVRPRFIGCEKTLAGLQESWEATRDCRTPPSMLSREPPYLPKGAPYKLVTRSWLNYGTADQCVWPDSNVCPAPAESQCFGPHPCPPLQKKGAAASP